MSVEPSVRDRATPVVILILVAAAAVRLWGLTFGFPHVLAHPDEVRVVHTGVEFLSGNLHPGFFNYPSLFMYGLGALDLAYCGAGIVSGRFESVSACAASWPAAWEPFFLLARGLSACAGVATVWLAWRVGRRLFDEETGLAGAAFLAVAFLHVRDSHFGVTDVSMTAVVVGALLLLLRAHDRPSHGRFAIAGLVAGLATATKYNAALLVVAAGASAVVSWLAEAGVQGQDHRRRRAGLDTRLPVYGAAMAAGFLIGAPFSVIDPARFWADASGEAMHLAAGHGIVLDVGWRHHLVVTLWHGLTWPLLLTALAGVVWMVVRQPRRAALLLAFPIAYYIVAGRGMTVFARYMVPVVPFLCLSAGFATVAAARQLARYTRIPPAVAAAALVTVVGGASLAKALALDQLLARTDSRVLASEWLLDHAPPGSSIHSTGSRFGRPELAPHGSGPGFVEASFDETRGAFRAAGADLPHGPDFIVVQDAPLDLYSGVPPGLRAWLDRYDLRYSVRAFDDREARVYDQQDAFFLPLANFARIGRPGPNLWLYARRQ